MYVRTARPIDIICVITRNPHNEFISYFILRKKTWPIWKRGELESGLEFERNGFDDGKNFSEGSFKKGTQVIRVQEQQYYCFTPTAMYRQYDGGLEITHDTIIVQIIIAILSYNRYITHSYCVSRI